MKERDENLFLERKRKTYDFICSNEYKPMKHKQLLSVLFVPKDYRAEFGEIMQELIVENKVYVDPMGRYVREGQTTVVGTYIDSCEAYSTVYVDGSKEGILISKEDIGKARHNDTVVVGLFSNVSKRLEGRIIRVVQRGYEEVPAIYFEAGGRKFADCDIKQFGSKIKIEGDAKDVFVGDRVMVKITDYDDLTGYITSVFGRKGNPKDDITAIVRCFGVEEEFCEETLMEAKRLPDKVLADEIKGRTDLRGELTVTIDGVDTKDYDDAITIDFDGENYKLGVHIADVTHYVKENSPLDKSARARATSVYLPDRVIPMLPYELSNGICSLNQGVDRLTLSCIMTVNREGEVLDHIICESVINVNERMTYDDVYAIVEDHDEELCKRYEYLVEKLELMDELAIAMSKKSDARGSLAIGAPEVKIKIDENGKPYEIKKVNKNRANDLIEQFMIAANVCVASEYYWREVPFLYRVHETPSPKAIDEFNEFLTKFGFYIKKSSGKVRTSDYATLYKRIEGHSCESIIRSLSVRSLQRAMYSDECEAHFGLALEQYTHFTSPIRRYCDLQIHRIIKENLNDRFTEGRSTHYKEILKKVASDINRKSRNADNLSREAEKYEMTYYMSEHIGEVFEGVIVTILSSGFFVELDNMVSGKVNFFAFKEYMVVNEGSYSCTGKKSGITYTVGDRIKVKVILANRFCRMIDFEVEELCPKITTN